MNLKLQIPGEIHRDEYDRVMTKWEALEDNIQPQLLRRKSADGAECASYDKWLAWCEDDRTTGSMLSTHIPCTLFFCVRDETEIVGAIVLNHADTRRGHLHAGIVPWRRGSGLGTKMLRLALEECRKKGIQKVHIVPYRGNLAAVQTILHNGGTLTEEFLDDGRPSLRYEICL